MHIHFVLCSIRVFIWVIILIILDLVNPAWPRLPVVGSEMRFGRWLWMMIICGLSVSIRHIHALVCGLLWWLVLVSWLSTFEGFIIIIVLTWMGPLTYIFYGHMVYWYSFLMDLDIISSLIQPVFGFGNLQMRYGWFYQFATVWPWKTKIKCFSVYGEIS